MQPVERGDCRKPGDEGAAGEFGIHPPNRAAQRYAFNWCDRTLQLDSEGLGLTGIVEEALQARRGGEIEERHQHIILRQQIGRHPDKRLAVQQCGLGPDLIIDRGFLPVFKVCRIGDVEVEAPARKPVWILA